MAIPIKLEKNGDVSEWTNCYYCREQIISEFTNLLTARKEHSAKIIKTLDKARLLVFNLKDSDMKEDSIKKVLTTIGVIEKKVGMPRTIVKRVINKEILSYNILMFEGSIKWYRSSHTMSLWLLLIRLCLRDPNMFYGETFSELCEIAKTFPKGPESNGINWVAEDKGYCRSTIHAWIPLMSNVNSIFPPKVRWTSRYDINKVHEAKPGNAYVTQPYVEGIHKLATGDSLHVGQKKFNEIMKE